jgi:CubicO group peptidase (beta-lactamase class C family)
MKKAGIILLLIIATSGQVFAQTNTFVKDSLDNYLERYMQEFEVPGMAVAIIKNGKIECMKGFGVKTLNQTELVNENTLFMVASNTKAFTGTLLAMLDQEKKISLDDKVVKYLPTFKLYDDFVTQQTNIRDLLSHRIGLKTFQGDFCYWNSNLTRKEVIEKFGKQKSAFDFRTGFGYCNAGFLTAGEIIPIVAGKPWENLLQERLLSPLKMTNTLPLSINFGKSSNHASPHSIYDGQLITLEIPMIDNLAPAGSICSSIKDMSNWLMMQLDSGKFEGKQIVPFKALAQTRKGHSIVSTSKSRILPRNFSTYGLGWFIQDHAGRQIFQHSGGADGFVTQTCFVPEENLGMVILSNSDSNTLYEALMYQILDAYMDRPFKDYGKIYLKGELNSREEEAKRLIKLHHKVKQQNPTGLPLMSYTGNYSHPVYGNAEIKLEGGKLNLYLAHHPVSLLENLGGNAFMCTYGYKTLGIHEVNFKVNSEQVISVDLPVNDFVEFDSYEFIKN